MSSTSRPIAIVAITFLLGTATVAVQGDAPIQLTLSVDQRTYAPYEPVVVRYELANLSASSIEVPNFFDHRSGYLTFEIGEGGAEFRPFRTGPQGCGPYESVTLGAGERLSGQMSIVSNGYGRLARTSLLPEYKGLKEFPFSAEGTFRIRASYAISLRSEPPAKIDSIPVNIALRRMTAQEEKAFALFNGPEDYASATGAAAGSDDLASDIKRWERFAEQFSSSVYAPAVRLNLGTIYLEGIGLAAPDFRKAKSYFTATLGSRKQALRGEALLGLARANIEEGLVDDARKTLALGMSEAITTDQRRRFLRLQRRMDGSEE